MTAARSFTDLLFWQRARQWSKEIYHLTLRPPFSRDERLVRQINDSSESTFANMAEGFGRGTQEEFVTFLGYSLGSLDETQSHLCAAYGREFIDKRHVRAALERRHRNPQNGGGVHPFDDPSPWRRPHTRQVVQLVTENVGNL